MCELQGRARPKRWSRWRQRFSNPQFLKSEPAAAVMHVLHHDVLTCRRAEVLQQHFCRNGGVTGMSMSRCAGMAYEWSRASPHPSHQSSSNKQFAERGRDADRRFVGPIAGDVLFSLSRNPRSRRFIAPQPGLPWKSDPRRVPVLGSGMDRRSIPSKFAQVRLEQVGVDVAAIDRFNSPILRHFQARPNTAFMQRFC